MFLQWSESPLFVAASDNRKELVEVLLAAGANVDLQNKVLSSLS